MSTELVDHTPPNVTILMPADGSYLNTDYIIVSWSASDNVGLSYFEVFLDNVSYANTSEFNMTVYGLEEGLHSIEVKAYDLLNNSALSRVSFIIDTTPPEIVDPRVDPTAGFTCTRYNVSANVFDESGVDEVTAKVVNQAGRVVETLSLTGRANFYTGGITGLAPSTYSVNLTARDRAGNIARQELTFNVTRYILEWLPPLSLDRTFNPGSTIPVKFVAYDALTQEFIADETVYVMVFNPEGLPVFKATHGEGKDSTRISLTDEYHIVNFNSEKGWAGDYTVKIGFLKNHCDTLDGSIELRRGKSRGGSKGKRG
jgi:hypothetical protein